jgi:hypothetical protein
MKVKRIINQNLYYYSGVNLLHVFYFIKKSTRHELKNQVNSENIKNFKKKILQNILYI